MKYLILGLISICTLVANQKTETPKTYSISIEQKEAFKVLNQKCNVCHTKQNPSKIFTLGNMNDFARKINRQVFVWKRMPKGNKISLSKKEKITLKNWLNNQLNK